ncbi:unnamed protein product, partial [Closterium sp. Naga37s-1]
AAFLAAGASASIFPPFLAHGGVSNPAASAAQAAKPMVWKGKTVLKYVAKFRPSTLNGKVIGDKGASGKYVTKIV